MEKSLSLHTFGIIFLWSFVAYMSGNVIGLSFSFLFGILNIRLNSSTFVMFLPVIVFYAFAYGYCAFEAVRRLKGKTNLSGLSTALYMAGFVIVLGLAAPAFIAVVLGAEFRSSANLAGLIALFVGGHLGGKKDSKKGNLSKKA